MRLLIRLFSPATGTWGGLTRVLAIAQAAQAAGHQVAFSYAGALCVFQAHPFSASAVSLSPST